MLSTVYISRRMRTIKISTPDIYRGVLFAALTICYGETLASPPPDPCIQAPRGLMAFVERSLFNSKHGCEKKVNRVKNLPTLEDNYLQHLINDMSYRSSQDAVKHRRKNFFKSGIYDDDTSQNHDFANAKAKGEARNTVAKISTVEGYKTLTRH